MSRVLALAVLLACSMPAFAQHDHHAMQMQMQEATPTEEQTAKTLDARLRGHDDRGQEQSATQYQPPALTDADRAAAFPDLSGHDMSAHMDDDPLVWKVIGDRLEQRQGDASAWDLQAWAGHDTGRLWLRSEGEREHGKTSSSIEALWGKPVDAWWDVLAGVRHDGGAGPSREWLALGVQGLAPYKFEVSATAYLGDGGRSMLKAEAEYELLLTNRLILQPSIEVELHGRDDLRRGIGSGLAKTEAGLRLRYEVRREFAPYVGYAWSHAHGRTADLRRAAAEAAFEHGWVAGLRFWF